MWDTEHYFEVALGSLSKVGPPWLGPPGQRITSFNKIRGRLKLPGIANYTIETLMQAQQIKIN